MMASFFSPIQQHGQPVQQQQQQQHAPQQTPPPPGLAYSLPHQLQPGSLGSMSSMNINTAGLNGYGSSHGHGPHGLPTRNTMSQTPGSSSILQSPSNNPMQKFQERLESFRRIDKEREDMVIELAKEYQALRERFREVSDDLLSEQQSRRTLQQRTRELEDTLTSHSKEQRRNMDSNPFVFVVLDGDGAIFSEDMIKFGRDGGSLAAQKLATGIRNHLQQSIDANIDDWTIVVQVILNMDGLARKLVACGLINRVEDLTSFAVGFNRSYDHFCFIDVGEGKERADYRIRETFRLFSRMPSCKRIYFGPCHDNGYLPFLEKVFCDSATMNKTYLIESTPAEPGYYKFANRIKFEDVFRTAPLPAKPTGISAAVLSMAVNAAALRSNEIGVSSAPPTASPSATTAVANPPSVASASPHQASATPAAPPASWAAMSKSGAGKTIDITPVKKPPKKYILLNSQYERLDEPLPPTQPQYVKKFNDRIREKNCCNNYHLKGFCTNGDACNFQHGDRLSDGEQRVLRLKARSIKCNSSSWCEDFDCPYGHRCKYGKDCTNDDCRFYDTHHVDSRPAFKKFEDGSYESLPTT